MTRAGGHRSCSADAREWAAYFRYMGSLTTPPCSEGLTWTVYKQPIEASTDQIKQFASLFPTTPGPYRRAIAAS